MVQPSCSNQNAGDINSIVKKTDRNYANMSFSKLHQTWSSYLYRFLFNLPDCRNTPMCFLSGFLPKRSNILLYQMMWKWSGGRILVYRLLWSIQRKSRFLTLRSVKEFFWGQKHQAAYISISLTKEDVWTNWLLSRKLFKVFWLKKTFKKDYIHLQGQLWNILRT